MFDLTALRNPAAAFRQLIDGLPVQTEYINGWMVWLMFLAGGIPIVGLGMRALTGLGPVRQWTAIGCASLSSSWHCWCSRAFAGSSPTATSK